MQHELPTEARRPSGRGSRLAWLVIVGGIVVVMVSGGIWYAGYASLESQLAALRAKGLPATAAEVNEFYRVPEGVADTTDLWVAALDAVRDANLQERGKSLPIVGEGPTPVPPPGQPWAEREASGTLLAELKSELLAIRQAAEAGGQARLPVDFVAGINTLFPYTTGSREVARLLVLDAHVSAHDENDSLALQDVKAIFALSDALRGEPALISQLVRIAIHAVGCDAVERLLPYSKWTDAELQSLQPAVSSANFREELSNAFCGERAMCLTELDRFTLGPLRPANKREALRVFESSIEGLSRSWPDALTQQRKLAARARSLAAGKLTRMRFIGVLLLLPALEQTVVAGARAEANQRCTIVALAAHRYRLRHGRWPDSLSDVGQEFLGAASDPAAVLIDPFDGQPLRYKTEETRVVIYSIGENEKDDGGDCDHDSQQRPLDVGFSLKK